jgi:hypothetical protein
MEMRFLAAAVLALPLVAAAQNNGELWEISTQMNIPGMPAGMGGQTQRVCQGDDPERRAASDKDQKDCKVTDKKQTATRTTITMQCKQGTMTVDQQYNAARTEFKGSIKMTSKDGDFNMNTTGRKVGACNVQQAAKERDEKIEGMKKQAAAAQAQGAAAQKQYGDSQVKQCTAALDNMQFTGLGLYGQCYKKSDNRDCRDMAKAYPDAAKICTAKAADFCKRYQTQEGFLKAKADENAAQMCGVTTASVKAAQCPKAAQSESLAFLGTYCPNEAKPLAQQHCAGRDYTSKMGGKYARFCEAYLANADFEKPQQSQAQKATDQVKQGVSKGIDKLKGFFGR